MENDFLNKIHFGDCLEIMPLIPEKSIDLILCDLPYGTTACKWDTIIPFDKLWIEYKRLIKDNGTIVLTASQPFTSALVMSNPAWFKFSWVWDKKFPANYPLAKRQPMKVHEDVLVFAPSTALYIPKMIKRDNPIKKGANNGATVFQKGLEREDYKGKIYDEKYPESIIEFNVREERGIHPTAKPVSLFSYLIETHSKENDIVLDNCIGSGTTALACKRTNRNFIGIEKGETEFNIATNRLNGTLF